jgi:hypothetical protein
MSDCKPGVIHVSNPPWREASASSTEVYDVPWCLQHQEQLLTHKYCAIGLDHAITMLADLADELKTSFQHHEKDGDEQSD